MRASPLYPPSLGRDAVPDDLELGQYAGPEAFSFRNRGRRRGRRTSHRDAVALAATRAGIASTSGISIEWVRRDAPSPIALATLHAPRPPSRTHPGGFASDPRQAVHRLRTAQFGYEGRS